MNKTLYANAIANTVYVKMEGSHRLSSMNVFNGNNINAHTNYNTITTTISLNNIHTNKNNVAQINPFFVSFSPHTSLSLGLISPLII